MIIYKITNTVNSKSYIGKCVRTQIYHRYGKDWASNKTLNRHLKNAVLKYGKTLFKVEILHRLFIKDAQLLSLLEKHYIALHKSNNPDYGYNFTDGGDGGHIFNNESRKKLSAAKLGKPLKTSPDGLARRIAGIKLANTGKKKTPEHLKKLSEIKKKTYCFQAFGKTNTFKGIAAAATYYNVSTQTISRAVAKDPKTRAKVKWLKFLESEGN